MCCSAGIGQVDETTWGERRDVIHLKGVRINGLSGQNGSTAQEGRHES